MSFEETRTIRSADTGASDELRCVACDHPITECAYRTDMMGAHEHTFVNPGGFAYAIGCFAAAPGCAYQGVPDPAFSWFPGWTWQIAVCARCRVHLGWIYRLAGQQFHGLILAALR